ncbi:MAG TPA: ribonuclease III [Phycisphaerales bacterium]|nr:ribonuclease III [Phycisphaerales bacterium]
MDTELLQQIQEALGYQFKDPGQLCEALTHSSRTDDRLKSNERLEFLGDSVLGLVICRALYDRFPRYQEGDLTKIKSMLVSRKVCAKIAGQMGLVQYLRLGKGTDRSSAVNGSIAAGCLEAVIAAIYFDGGLEAAQDFILRLFEPLIELADAEQHQNNFKSVLQQHCQQVYNRTPYYELLDEKGPDHNKCFEVGVVIDHRRFPSAWGVTKKDAEQMAARNALIEMHVIEPENE